LDNDQTSAPNSDQLVTQQAIGRFGKLSQNSLIRLPADTISTLVNQVLRFTLFARSAKRKSLLTDDYATYYTPSPSLPCAVKTCALSVGDSLTRQLPTPAGSNRSGRGGNEAVKAFGVEDHFRVVWRPRGPQRAVNVEQIPKTAMRRPTPSVIVGKADMSGEASGGCNLTLRRDIDGGTCG